MDVDGFDGEGGNLGDEHAAEGVSHGSIYSDEGEAGIVFIIVVELDYIQARIRQYSLKGRPYHNNIPLKVFENSSLSQWLSSP